MFFKKNPEEILSKAELTQIGLHNPSITLFLGETSTLEFLVYCYGVEKVLGKKFHHGINWDSSIETCTLSYKIDSQWEFAVWYKELNLVLCDNLEG